MRTYLVGGAVRDKLLGVPFRDRDYLIIGVTPQELLQKGFVEIGKSFTVFLHPVTREEYTLAESLEQDLGRRDLTINALAMDSEDKIIDLFGGLNDLQNKVLKHIHEANFFEDPLRLYRVARLKCQYPEFTIDPTTLELMKRISREASFKDLSGERILAVLKGALLTNWPSIFFQVLKEVQALDVHFPEMKPERIGVLDKVCQLSSDLAVRFASLMHEGKRLLIPNDWLEASTTVSRFQVRVHSLKQLPASSVVKMFYDMDAFRKPHLVHTLALVSEADDMAQQGQFMEKCFQAVMNVSSKDVEAHLSGKEIGDAIHAERIKRLEAFLK